MYGTILEKKSIRKNVLRKVLRKKFTNCMNQFLQKSLPKKILR